METEAYKNVTPGPSYPSAMYKYVLLHKSIRRTDNSTSSSPNIDHRKYNVERERKTLLCSFTSSILFTLKVTFGVNGT